MTPSAPSSQASNAPVRGSAFTQVYRVGEQGAIFDQPLNDLHLKIHEVIGELPELKASPPATYFQSLVSSIESQQLSTKVADTSFSRVEALVGSEFSPQAVLQISDDQLREQGLSWSKVSYVKNIAESFQNKLIIPEEIEQLSDQEVIAKLTKIKGVGQWTAEMFLIFTLARPDVFPVGDYGLRSAISTHYKLPKKAPKQAFLELSAGWAPHRSLASRILWKSLELPDAAE